MHGERRTYARGCRCLPCRVTNAAYSSAHRRASSTVPADAARAHLHQLAQLGIGARSIARQTGVAASVVWSVRGGHLQTLRPSTSARLLTAEPTPAPGALVAATRTWRFLDSLQREGYTNRELAFHLGLTSQQLQLAPARIRASTAQKVARLYQRLA